MALDTIPKQEGGKLKAVASGTLPSGQPVVVNSDGTVSVVGASSTAAPTIGDGAIFNSGASTDYVSDIKGVYDANAQKVVLAYSGSGKDGIALVGTISGSSVSFGSPVTFATDATDDIAIAYDSSNNKVVIAFEDGGNLSNGTYIVGTVSGNSISFGSEGVYGSNYGALNQLAFDENAGKFVFFYLGGGGLQANAVAGTVSGTTMSFGTVLNFGFEAHPLGISYDSTAQKCVGIYRDNSNSNYGTAVVFTISGTTVSKGTATVFLSSAVTNGDITYDSTASKHVIGFRDGTNSSKAAAVVGTVSGTGISFGSIASLLSTAGTGSIMVSYNPTVDRTLLTFEENEDGSVVARELTVNGTSVSAGTARTVSSDDTNVATNFLASAAGSMIVAFRNKTPAFDEGTALVYKMNSSNLTSENYIGISPGFVEDSSVSESVGTSVVFETGGIADEASSAFDSNSNKTVIAYVDIGNGSEGTAVVGTVSGNAISFGSEANFSGSGISTRYIAATFDSSNNKIVIAYQDASNSQYGTAVVGTVSGTSISFGTPVVFESANCQFIDATFDSNSNKVVVAYADQGNVSGAGTAIVGTVSGTSISFGTPTVFENANTDEISIGFDSDSNKVVVAYQDAGNSNHGTAAVGTVSGTSISFGTPVVFQAADTRYTSTTFDSTNNKIVIAYENDGSSEHGTAVVGTVSGTSISFGTPVVFAASVVSLIDATFDSNANKVVVQYRDETNSNYGTIVSGTVSGTTITFDTPLVFNANTSSNSNTNSFDSNANKVVIAYNDGGNSNKGTSAVYQTGYTSITRGQVNDGSSATVDIIGSVSTNQVGLTAGQKYYVQTDGTIGETPADPSVLAGTAVSATKMVVKS